MIPLYRRLQAPLIQESLLHRRVTLLAGARQTGKTTEAKALASPSTDYRTLDNLSQLKAAQTDPHDFVQHTSKMMIIDEVQRVPELLLAIKLLVDENRTPGQFLLTGSTNLQSLPSVQESLAGRIQKIRLRCLIESEIRGTENHFLEKAFSQDLKSSFDPFPKSKVLALCFRGGFPEAIFLSEKQRVLWHQDYMDALLERDLKGITKIQRHHTMKELVKILAAWSSKFRDISTIGAHLSVSRPTLESYINALEALYIFERLPAYTSTDYDRVGKHSKLFITDTGLMSSLLKWTMETVRLDSDRCGKIIETFVFNELSALIDAHSGLYTLSHYRDREQREIDFIIEKEGTSLLGIEVKSSSTVGKNDFKSLQWFKEFIAKKQPFVGIVLYTGDMTLSFGPDLWAVPISALWV